MRIAFRSSIRSCAAVLLGLGGLTYATSASAACGDSATLQHSSWQTEQDGLQGQAENPAARAPEAAYRAGIDFAVWGGGRLHRLGLHVHCSFAS